MDVGSIYDCLYVCLDAGKSHVVIITAQGDCYSWGAGYYGRLGIGNTANAYVPTKCDFPRGVKVNRLRKHATRSSDSTLTPSLVCLWIWICLSIFNRSLSVSSLSTFAFPLEFLDVR